MQIVNGSAILSDTLGAIDGGDITLGATELIEIKGSDPTNQVLDPGFSPVGIFFPISSRIITNTFGSGNGGDIIFKTPKLSVLDGAKIQAQTVALANDSSQQLGQGGNIMISNATSVELRGLKPLLGVADNAQEFFPIPSEAGDVLDLERLILISRGSSIDIVSASSGSASDISIFTERLQLKDGSSISNSPVFPGIGNGGDININAQELIEISGSSASESQVSSLITANTFGFGNAGSINLTTNKLLLQDGGGITAGTLALGDGGEIVINTKTLEIIGTSGNGVLRSGLGSETFTTGNAGNVTINTERLTIEDRGQITVRGLSSGTPGNLFINADTVELNNSARITAANASAVEGGNIQLHIKENLTLQENSFISAQALANANGGNIDIDAKFIIAFPQQNNDILANAVGGNGGNINISARGIFGIEERNSQPSNLTNDIDASSELGTSGEVALIFPQFTATQGLFNLPPDFVDVNYLFKNQFCQISQDSKYVVTGRGGIPLVPDDDLLSEHTWSDWRIINPELETGEILEQTGEIEQVKKIEMIQGWVTDRQGRIILTANPPVVTPHKPALPTPSCNQIKN